jgi:hypothetical protein
VDVKRGYPLVALLLLVLVSGGLVSSNYGYAKVSSDTSSEVQDKSPLENEHILSDHLDITGALNPVEIEQRGNETNPTLHAETDSGANTQSNLSIDTMNNWVGSRASIDLWNLERLYVENGSLSTGTEGQNLNPSGIVAFGPDGWNATSGSPDPSMDMYADYSSGQVSVMANGYGTGGNYFYANGSFVYWTQTVYNLPYLDDFNLNFDYYYTGLGPDLNPNVTLRVYIDDTLIWTNTTETIIDSQWYNSGDLSVDLTGIGSRFEFKVGLYFNGDVNHDKQFIEFNLDNLKFTGATPPSFDDAGLTVSIGSDSVIATGSSTGYAQITNSSFWNIDAVLVEIDASLGYSFDYTATMLSHRYLNSTKSLSLLDEGTQFSSNANDPNQIEFYTFLGVIPDLNDFSMYIRLPDDWENITVVNPFGTDMTASCTVAPGLIVVPNSIVDVLGWWQFFGDTPNYARSVQTLKLVEMPSTWVPDSVFRSTNITKPVIEIGGTQPLLDPLQDVNITWAKPDDTIWFSEVVSGGSNGEINGSALEFGPTNATAGRWEVYAFWTNGTEIAFGSHSFDVYHRATLVPEESLILQESGLSVTNFLYYQDYENNESLMDLSATITANWSSTTVTFVPDLIHNYWLGTFDTSLVDPGDNLVIVNASRPYFDDVSCTFIIRISYTDNQLIISNPTAQIGLGDKYTAYFNYTDAFGAGVENANVTVGYTGTVGGITWAEASDLGNGDYSLEFTAVHTGTYVITISAARDFYEAAQDALSLSIGERTATLSLENGTSAFIGFGEQYRLVLRYINGSSYGLEGANVTIESVTPSVGFIYGVPVDEGNGYYSIVLEPDASDTYTLLIKVSLQDHSTQFTSFTITATVISTQLRIVGTSSPAIVSVNQPFDILILYERTGITPANISDAIISLAFTSFDSLSYEITPLTSGYLVTLQTNQIGSYEFNIYANKTGFQTDFVTFTLFVRARGMQVVMEPVLWTRLQDLQISLQLVESGSNTSVTDATVSYWLVRSGGIVVEGDLDEVAPGIYSATVRPQWFDGTGYSIQIFAQKDNFELDADYTFPVLQYTPPGILWQLMVSTYGPPIGVVAAVAVVALAGRTVYKRKKKAQFAIDLANKRRFDDVDNIIGVIVMHKTSGLPIYSRIFKGGFEEGIVAAFIAAVTHFREEFEMLDTKHIQAIPISDIIRAVQTENLICAFITVRSASIEHNRRMEDFGSMVAEFLDDFYTESRPASNQDMRISEILDFIFDKTMDGTLLKFHKLTSDDGVPKRYQPIKEVFQDPDSAQCTKPVYLARSLSRFGLTESRGCTLVTEAIENGIITQCDPSEIEKADIDIAKYLKDSDSS